MLSILIVVLVSACIMSLKIFIHYCEKLTPEVVAEKLAKKLWVWAEYIILGIPKELPTEGSGYVDITKC